jgi:DNA polymerase/3'-5' exonuclease PolX
MTKKDYKETIEKILKFLINREKFNNEPYKVRAYEKVLVQIEDLDHVYSEEDLKEIEGIGVKIRAKLQEIFSTGTYSKYVETDLSVAYKDLLQIYGIGPKKAKELINQGIYNLTILKEKLEENPELLNDSQKLGLEYYDDSLERIPREEMNLHNNYLKIEARRFGLKTMITGSYRRKMPTSGDIDCLIHYDDLTPKNSLNLFNELIDDLILSGYIIGVLSRGIKKCLCFCKIKDKVRRMDLLLTTKEEYPFALLYFTGSKQFNISMRKLALEKGYSLSEHSLTKISSKRKVTGLLSEKDIFEFLEMSYVSPAKRNL